MKLIFTADNYPGKGGVETYIDSVAGIIQRYHDLTIVSPGAPGEYSCGGVKLISFSEWRDILGYLENARADIVHIHGRSEYILRHLHESSRSKIVIHHHNYGFFCPGQDFYWTKQRRICPSSFGCRCLFNAYLRTCQMSRRPGSVLAAYDRVRQNLAFAGRASLFIANSSFLQHELVENGLPANKTAVLNYFTSLPRTEDSGSIPGRVLFIGRIAESKGIDALLQALALLGESPEWSLVIAGDGYYEHRIRNCIQKLGLMKRVSFAGWVSATTKSQLLREASVVVVPSLWPEAFGIVGIEAMAHARPVVAFNVGGIKDWLSHDRTGYLVPPGNIHDMAFRIKSLLQNPEVAVSMGKVGQHEVKRRFLADRHLQALLRLYDQVRRDDLPVDI